MCLACGYEIGRDSGRSTAATSPDDSAWRNCGNWYESHSILESPGAGQYAPPTSRAAPLWPHTPHLDGVASSSLGATQTLASQHVPPYTRVEANRGPLSPWDRHGHWDDQRAAGVDAPRI